MADVVTREMTIPLRDAWKVPRHQRAQKCIAVIRRHVQQHMRKDIHLHFQRDMRESQTHVDDKIWIDESVNHAIWVRGMQKPPRRVRVVVTKEEGFPIEVKLAEE